MYKLKRSSGSSLKSFAFALSLGSLLCPVAQAYGGDDLFRGYESQQKLNAGGEPNFYLLGLYHSYVWAMYDALETKLCAPEDITRGEVLEAVNAQLGMRKPAGNTPESAATLAAESLRAAFSCKQ